MTSVSKVPEEVWNTPAAVFVITPDDIRRSGAVSIPDLLRLIPGVDVAQSQSGSWAVGVRGFNSAFSKDLLVLIDGRSVYTPLFEGVYWDAQDLVFDDIDRIEVIRGPGGTIWGPNAVNGVINIITKKAAETKGAFVHFSGAGSVNRITGELRYGAAPLSNLQFRLFGKGFNRGPEKNASNDPYDHWHQARGGARLDWQPTKRDSFTASAMLYQGKTGDQNTIGEFYPPSQRVVDGQQVHSGGDLLFRWDHQLDHGSSFFGQAYFDRTNRATSQFTETRNTVDIDIIAHLAQLPRQDLIFGAGLRESPSYVEQTQATVNFPPNRFNNYVYSFFAQDTLKLVPDKLSLTLGSKFIDDAYSGWNTQPTVQLLWKPRESTSVWASVARALRTPGRLDRDLSLIGNVTPGGPKALPIFIQVEGNPKFQPEVLIGWSVGYRQLLRKRLYADLVAFHNQYDNIESYGGATPLFTFPNSPYPYEQINIMFGNGLRGVSDGLEIAPEWKIANWLEVRGTFSHVHVSLHSKPGYEQDSYAHSIETESPHREATAQAILSVPRGFEIVPDYRFVSALPGFNIPSYQTADARIGYKASEHVEVSAVGRNLLQAGHYEFGGTTEIKREVFADVRWNW